MLRGEITNSTVAVAVSLWYPTSRDTVDVPAVVGVPLMRPLCERVKPTGRDPLVTVLVSGGTSL